MKFSLIDKIDELVPGERLVAVKNLSLAEEYLGDHFPKFPVMPGVLMVEALVQAGAWLVRASTDFRDTVVVLAEARNVRYSNFVAPGNRLILEVDTQEIGDGTTMLRARGHVDGAERVSIRKLTLRHYRLDSHVDERLRTYQRELFELLTLHSPTAGAN